MLTDTILEDFLLIDRGEVRWIPTNRTFPAYTNNAKILIYLHSANGVFVTSYSIAEFVWPWIHPAHKLIQVAVHIKDLRKKEYIPVITRRGHGYALRVDERY